jgi:hypothetical protein
MMKQLGRSQKTVHAFVWLNNVRDERIRGQGVLPAQSFRFRFKLLRDRMQDLMFIFPNRENLISMFLVLVENVHMLCKTCLSNDFLYIVFYLQSYDSNDLFKP